MPPVGEGNDQHIRSLREQGGRGTLPWTSDLEQKSIFLGLNCLAGHVVQTGRPMSVGDVTRERYIPVFAYPEDMEASAAACPILLEGKIAGCLLAASAKLDHFSQERMDLLVNLTYVYSLALNPGDFYDPRLLRLRYIPHPTKQQELLLSFRLRVNDLMIESARSSHLLTSSEAENIAWQHIEDRLIQMGVDEEIDVQPGV
ncbi:MAG TPA: GAF domain-containing protein, partial [Ktedonobacteraceae bacterium]|nr:GAF domain-containing protein [Ktedonobacteraceae bacterium]